MKRGSYASAVFAIFTIILLFSASVACATGTSAPVSQSDSSGRDDGLSGKVVETMNAGGYTYVCIEKKGVKTWVAVPQTKVTVGQEITFQPGGEMTDFTSKSLNRTFKSIYFSGGPLNASTDNEIKSSQAIYGGSAASSGQKISVAKAKGKDAYTVAEIYEKKASLSEKQVMVRGKVVKVSSGIMGKNWIHLEDGTGNISEGTNDIIATSQDSPVVGEVVTVKGTVYKDKDFGAGYKFRVIMEQASVQK